VDGGTGFDAVERRKILPLPGVKFRPLVCPVSSLSLLAKPTELSRLIFELHAFHLIIYVGVLFNFADFEVSICKVSRIILISILYVVYYINYFEFHPLTFCTRQFNINIQL
jgi:hypothetical protein